MDKTAGVFVLGFLPFACWITLNSVGVCCERRDVADYGAGFAWEPQRFAVGSLASRSPIWAQIDRSFIMQAAIKDSYDLVIVGAGPAGLSAAARAAEIDREAGLQQPSYVLLESADAIAQTIQAYQVGKHVMDEPSFLNLRSPIGFSAGKREDVLMRYNAY